MRALPFFKFLRLPIKYRHALVAVLILAGSPAARPCNMEEDFLKDRIVLQTETRKITVLGWRHHSEDEIKESWKTFFEILGSTDRSCAFMHSKISPILESQRLLAKASIDLYRRLLEAASLSPGASIGVEYSQEELNQLEADPNSHFNQKNLSKAFAAFGKMSKMCADLSKEINTFALITLLPENYFRFEKQSLNFNLKGVDDSLIRKKFDDETSVEERTYNPFEQPLPASAAVGILALEKRFEKNLQAPSEDEIQSAVASIQDPELKRKLVSYFRFLAPLAKMGLERNAKIAENAFKIPGEVVVVVGKSHLPGLAEELMKTCEKAEELETPVCGLSSLTPCFIKPR